MERINSGTYRVSSSRSSLSAATVSSSSSSSDDMARPRRAFNGIKSVDWNLLSQMIITVGETLCSKRRLCERINLQLILVNGALCSLESHHAHAGCSHAVEATQTQNWSKQSIYKTKKGSLTFDLL